MQNIHKVPQYAPANTYITGLPDATNTNDHDNYNYNMAHGLGSASRVDHNAEQNIFESYFADSDTELEDGAQMAVTVGPRGPLPGLHPHVRRRHDPRRRTRERQHHQRHALRGLPHGQATLPQVHVPPFTLHPLLEQTGQGRRQEQALLRCIPSSTRDVVLRQGQEQGRRQEEPNGLRRTAHDMPSMAATSICDRGVPSFTRRRTSQDTAKEASPGSSGKPQDRGCRSSSSAGHTPTVSRPAAAPRPRVPRCGRLLRTLSRPRIAPGPQPQARTP